MELVRAEVAVALGRMRHALLRAVTALLVTIVAAALLQVALVVFILAPLLARSLPEESFWLSLALPSVLALASLVGAGLAWASLRRSLHKSPPTIASPSERVRPEDSSRPSLVSLKEERVRQ